MGHLRHHHDSQHDGRSDSNYALHVRSSQFSHSSNIFLPPSPQLHSKGSFRIEPLSPLSREAESHWDNLVEDDHRRVRRIEEANLTSRASQAFWPRAASIVEEGQTIPRSVTRREPRYEKALPLVKKTGLAVRGTIRFKGKRKRVDGADNAECERARQVAKVVVAADAVARANEAKMAGKGTLHAKDLITVQGALYLAQSTSCRTFSRISTVHKCRHCVERLGGDTCRFRNIRAFPVEQNEDDETYSLRSDAMETSIFHHTLPTRHQEPELPSQSDLNRSMSSSERSSLMLTVAKALAPIFDDASGHVDQPNVLYRRREIDLSETCDFCSTGIFAASYLCRICGHEFCLTCHSNLIAQTDDDYSTKISNELFVCKKGSSQLARLHSYREMIPVTRFSVEEITDNLRLMRELINEHTTVKAIDAQGSDYESDGGLMVRSSDGVRRRQKAAAVVPNHRATTIDHGTLDEQDFLQEWTQGLPVIVENVECGIEWSPDLLIERYGDDECHIVRCDIDLPAADGRKRAKMESPDAVQGQVATTVRQFFSTFSMNMDDRQSVWGNGIWKLKDWPPTDSLKTAFPDLYEDFAYAVPMPDYTRRDGCKNVSSYFATNANTPDLGPKMYNAWPGGHGAGQKGTTRLHMDVADAVNILLFASNAKQCNAKQAGAQWDIFRVEDADAIRSFLCEKFGESEHGDPIHSQHYFLDDDLLTELYQSKGVYSYRIVQRCGQAIFVPAGCAHQVCNLTDCIKIATDFISPQSVERCFRLTEEFRNLSGEFQKSWKADMLQLRLQLWYAWSACRLMSEKEESGDREVREG